MPGLTAWVLCAAMAFGSDGMSDAELRAAEWSRDLTALLEGAYDLRQLPQLARSLGRFRDDRALGRLSILASLTEADTRRAAADALGTTPGGEGILRDRLRVEADSAVRSALLVALGRRGDAQDLPLLTGELARPWPCGAAGAEAIGLLAGRGVAIGDAVPSLVGATERLDRRLIPPAAFALARVAPEALSESQLRRLMEAWRRTPDGPARAWLVGVVFPRLDGAERRAWAHQALEGPWPLSAIQVLARVVPGDIAPGDLDALTASHHGGVAMAAEAAWRRFGLAPQAEPEVGAPGEVELALAGARTGEVTSAQLSTLMTAVTEDDDPRIRSWALAAVLGATADLGRAVWALRSADDPIVRELIYRHLAEHGAAGWVGDHLARQARVETSIAARIALCESIATRAAAGASESVAGTVRSVNRWAVSPDPALRRAARSTLEALGRPLPPARPGPYTGPLAPGEGLAEVGRITGATIVTTAGSFRVDLATDIAPLAVASFARLAEEDAFDGLAWHRVMPGFLAQTGDLRGDGMGGASWFLPDEVSSRRFERGSLGIARDAPDTGSSQWFVTVSPQPQLVGEYTWFGQVVRGMHVVERLTTDHRVLDVIVERAE